MAAHTTAIGYIRVSTEEQAEMGVSLDAQRAKIDQYAALHDLELARIYADEGISGKSMDKRRGLAEALEAACESPGHVFIVYSLSRMSRSVRDSLEIADRLAAAGAQFVSLTENIDTTTAMGELFFTICAAFSQLERRLIGERTKAALAQKRSAGEAWGHPPYGLARNGTTRLHEHDEEREVLAVIADGIDQGLSWAAIAADLNERGHRNRKGRQFDRGVVRRLGLRLREHGTHKEQ